MANSLSHSPHYCNKDAVVSKVGRCHIFWCVHVLRQALSPVFGGYMHNRHFHSAQHAMNILRTKKGCGQDHEYLYGEESREKTH